MHRASLFFNSVTFSEFRQLRMPQTNISGLERFSVFDLAEEKGNKYSSPQVIWFNTDILFQIKTNRIISLCTKHRAFKNNRYENSLRVGNMKRIMEAMQLYYSKITVNIFLSLILNLHANITAKSLIGHCMMLLAFLK